MTTWTDDRPEPNQELCERGYLIDWVEHLGCWEYKRMRETKWLTEDEALVKDGLVSRKYEFGDRVEILGSDEEGIVMGVDRDGRVVVRSETANSVTPFYPQCLAYTGPSIPPEPAWKASLRRMAEGERRHKEHRYEQRKVRGAKVRISGAKNRLLWALSDLNSALCAQGDRALAEEVEDEVIDAMARIEE